MTPLLNLQNAHFTYHAKNILHDLSLNFDRGEVVSLLGPNGSGKTTLLKILLGLLQPQQGQVFFQGSPLSCYHRKELAKEIAYVPQTHREPFAYSVEEVVLMGRVPHQSLLSQFSQEDREIAHKAMQQVHIEQLHACPYTEISGGERQLTLIARAIAQEATLFIMDEPVNGLDYGNQMRLLQHIKGLAQAGFSFIITTHFPDHAFMVSDRVILLKDGTIIGDGPPETTITSEALRSLYKIDVKIVSSMGTQICIPAWAESTSMGPPQPAHLQRDLNKKAA